MTDLLTHRRLALLVALGLALPACRPQTAGPGSELRGVNPVHVPVVASRTYAYEVAAPGGAIVGSDADRLDGWFRTMNLGFGDRIAVDGVGAETARLEVARIAARYGMLVDAAAPVSSGPIGEGRVRVVVTRTRADVPGCPDWSVMSQPSVENRMMSNFGCGVNSNLAAMVADPNDLVRGRDPGAVVDAATAAKAIDAYRKAPTTGTGGLQNTSAKGVK